MDNAVAGYHDYFCIYTNGFPHQYPVTAEHRDLLSTLSRRMAFEQIDLQKFSGFELLALQVVQIQAATRKVHKATDSRGTRVFTVYFARCPADRLMDYVTDLLDHDTDLPQDRLTRVRVAAPILFPEPCRGPPHSRHRPLNGG